MAVVGSNATAIIGGATYQVAGFSMGHVPPLPPVVKSGQLISTTAVKGQWRRTVRVIQGAGLNGWYARIETGKLGYPDEPTHIADGPGFGSKAEASLAAGRIMGGWLKDGWTFCENFESEHAHERMQAARFRLSPQVKNRKGRPLFTTIEYPEPYHLASYIRVTTDDGAKATHEFHYDYKTAFEANAAAKRRIDEAVQKGYQLMAQSAAATGANVAASAAVKLALDAPPAEDDFSGLVESFDCKPGASTLIVRISYSQKLDQRLYRLIMDRKPIRLEQLSIGAVGAFYPQKAISIGGTISDALRTQVEGITVLDVKLVGGAGAMPAMGVKRSFAEINAKPPEPAKIRHIEFED